MNILAGLVSLITFGLAFFFYSTNNMFWVAWEIPCGLITLTLFLISINENDELQFQTEVSHS